MRFDGGINLLFHLVWFFRILLNCKTLPITSWTPLLAQSANICQHCSQFCGVVAPVLLRAHAPSKLFLVFEPRITLTVPIPENAQPGSSDPGCTGELSTISYQPRSRPRRR